MERNDAGNHERAKGFPDHETATCLNAAGVTGFDFVGQIICKFTSSSFSPPPFPMTCGVVLPN